MDDLPVKDPGASYQKITLSRKTLDVYLKLVLLPLLLLEGVKHNQSLMQHCPITTELGGFPNLTPEAGSSFCFKLAIPATQGHTRRHQLSLADGDRPLPHWMAFRRQISGLAGLALTEDCGIYHLKVSVIGEQCAAYFYLHILNTTVTDEDQTRDTLSCSEGETTIWANLLLQLNPAILDASQRIRLVSTMAVYLRLPVGFVYLFSKRKSPTQQQEKFRVCKQGQPAKIITCSNEIQDASGEVAELLWPVSCQREERQSDLTAVLEYSVKAGQLARLLEAPVLGWRVLCAPGSVRRKVKRDLQRLQLTPAPNIIAPPPTQVHQTVKLEHSRIYSFSLTKLEPSLWTSLMHMGTRMEQTHAEDSTGNANYMQKIQVSSNSVFFIMQTTLYPHSEHVSNVPGCQVLTGTIIMRSSHASVCMEFSSSHQNQLSVHSSQKHTSMNQAASRTKPPVEATLCSDRLSAITPDTSQSISEYFQTTGLFLLPFFPEHTSTVRMFAAADTALSTLLASTTLPSIYPSVPLTPASHSVTSTLTHEAADRKSLATGLTLRPHQKETPLWTGSYRASLTDSESQPTVSSLGHIIYNHGPIKDLHAAKPTLYNLPSVSHPPPAENYIDASLLNSRLKTIHSLPPSNKIPSTRLFPDVSPTSYLMTERLSRTQHSDTIKHLSSVLNQDVMSQLNVTTQDVSSTTPSGQQALSGKPELESSLSTSLFESSVATFTPALPSALGFFSEHLETPNIVNPAFTGESLKLASSSKMPQLHVFSKSLLSNIDMSSSENNIESQVVTELASKSGAESYVDPNPLAQTLSSDILSVSLQPTYTSQALQMSLPLIKTLSVPLSLFKEQPSAESARESVQSVQQTFHTMLLGASQQIDAFHRISLVTGTTTSMYLNTAAGPSVTYPLPERAGQVSEFDPTAPSAVQELHTTPFIHQMQSLEPSFPVCGQSVMQDHAYINSCTPQIKSAYTENTVEHVVDTYSQDEKLWTEFPSQVLTFDSSGQFFSTEMSGKYLSVHTLLLEDVSREQTESSLLHLSATADTTTRATPQLDISETLPALEGISFSVITYTPSSLDSTGLSDDCVSVEKSLFICQSSTTHSSGPITNGRPTQQILSTPLSRFYGMSTTLLTSLKAVGPSSYRRESSVQTTPSSASISSTMNLPPTVLQSIPVLMATVGFPFHYSIPPKTFHDPEDGDADALSLEIRLIDGPPVSVGTWLALDGLELHGVPLEVDLHFAPQHLLLGARDGQGLSTWLPLTLDLRRSGVDPCHVLTLTAQRSLHSVLRQRSRVELLLTKLARFFNSSSSHHLSVVSMRPGSTVVSWYNYSLCGMGQSRVTRCLADQIQSMWLAMRSADGSVHPAFREAMLPEFPVTKVGPVSFRQDCFTTAATPAVHTTQTPGSGTNTSLSPASNTCVSASQATSTTSQQTTHYQWMAGMFTALLVVCILILIVIIVAIVLYFCKGHGRSRAVAIWPAGRVLSVQSRDLRAIRPRRPPIFQPELPPPPLRLWISLSQDDDGTLPSSREQEGKTADKALQPRPPRYDFSNI